MSFFALDVETANADYASLCQIGIARFEGNLLTDQWHTLINPEAYFDPFNVGIHGITPEAVADAPTFAEVHAEISRRIEGQMVVHHMPFDKTALARACDRHSLPAFQITWIDSALVTRRTWTEFSQRGYGLANIAAHLGIEFQHHDALADAIAAGKVFAQACELAGRQAEEWADFLKRRPSSSSTFTGMDGNPDGTLYGETLVFTGSLQIPRKEAAVAAAQAGCQVSNSVTRNTSILVVGIAAVDRFGGYAKSSKHRKAEQLISQGVPIQIVSEADFWGLVG